jgi:hypothetical protein
MKVYLFPLMLLSAVQLNNKSQFSLTRLLPSFMADTLGREDGGIGLQDLFVSK